MSLGSVGGSCPSCVLSEFLVHPQATHWWGGVKSRKGLDAICINPAHNNECNDEKYFIYFLLFFVPVLSFFLAPRVLMGSFPNSRTVGV